MPCNIQTTSTNFVKRHYFSRLFTAHGTQLSNKWQHVRQLSNCLSSSSHVAFHQHKSKQPTHFKKSTSLFNHIEANDLRMEYCNATFHEVIGVQCKYDEPPQAIQDLVINELDYDEIYTYNSNKHKNTDQQAIFFTKMSLVLHNNATHNKENAKIPRIEKYIDDFVIELTKACQLDVNPKLMMHPGVLKLKIGEAAFAANADREGHFNRNLIWVILENKHVLNTCCKGGDVQLASCMLAACQKTSSGYLNQSTIIQQQK